MSPLHGVATANLNNQPTEDTTEDERSESTKKGAGEEAPDVNKSAPSDKLERVWHNSKARATGGQNSSLAPSTVAIGSSLDSSRSGSSVPRGNGFDSLSLQKERVNGIKGHYHQPVAHPFRRDEIIRRDWRRVKQADEPDEDGATATPEGLGVPTSTTKTRPNLVASLSSSPSQDFTPVHRRRPFTMTPGPRTLDGTLWSHLHRGVIVRARDSGRRYYGKAKAGDNGVVEVNGTRYLDKHRYWIIIDRLPKHLDVRPIYTHTKKCLRVQDRDVKESSLCIYPTVLEEQEGRVNEATSGEVIVVKRMYGEHKLLPSARVRVVPGFGLDQMDYFELIGEVEESEVLKIKVASRSVQY